MAFFSRRAGRRLLTVKYLGHRHEEEERGRGGRVKWRREEAKMRGMRGMRRGKVCLLVGLDV